MTLAGVAQWIECWPANQSVAGSILSHGTYLGCGSGPQLGTWERQPHVDVSLPLSPYLPLSLKINKYLKKKNLVHVYIRLSLYRLKAVSNPDIIQKVSR